MLERHGQLKKRMYPWFEAPAVGFPMKYAGWVWDPSEREWVKTSIPMITVEVQVPAYPRPEEPPRPAQPLDVPGWYWNGRAEVWEEAEMPLKRVQQEMERPLAPVGPPGSAQPLDVPGWYWNGRAGVWEEIPLMPQEIAEDVIVGPKPKSKPGEEISWHVDGWVWSSVRERWEESPMPLEWVEVEQERGPKPERPPDTGVPTKAKGWTWSIEFKLWVANVFETAKAIFEPPPTLPPGIRVAGGPPIFPTDAQYIIIFRQLMDGGMTWDQANMWVDMMRKSWTELALAKQMPALIKLWNEVPEKIYHDIPSPPFLLGSLVGLYLFAAGVGTLIGLVLDSWLTPDVGHGILVAPPNTYLLGPDNWMYSRHIGTSLGGRPFYSECEDIGTEYTRHKRARWSGEPDIIDFLGGFLETGYVFPYWVKYLWSHWLVEYVGMLESSGASFYRLKKPDYDPAARLPIGWSAPESEWCQDFHYYL